MELRLHESLAAVSLRAQAPLRDVAAQVPLGVDVVQVDLGVPKLDLWASHATEYRGRLHLGFRLNEEDEEDKMNQANVSTVMTSKSQQHLQLNLRTYSTLQAYS